MFTPAELCEPHAILDTSWDQSWKSQAHKVFNSQFSKAFIIYVSCLDASWGHCSSLQLTLGHNLINSPIAQHLRNIYEAHKPSKLSPLTPLGARCWSSDRLYLLVGNSVFVHGLPREWQISMSPKWTKWEGKEEAKSTQDLME